MKPRRKIQFIALDFILLSLCYFGAVLMKRGYLDLNTAYWILFGVLSVSMMLSSALAGKFKDMRLGTFAGGF